MTGKRKSKKQSSKKIEIDFGLVFRSILLAILIGILVFLIFSLVESVPSYQGTVTNMTYRKYENILYDYEVMMYPSKIKVTSVESGQERLGIGVVTDPWNLDFGSIPIGSSSARYMDLTNIGKKDAKIIFRTYGNITPFVVFGKNNFILHSNESTTVKISFKSETEIGNYTGRIDRIVKISKYDFLYIFW